MNFEKTLSLYKNDKTLQILRAEHFPLLISFFHLAFKQQNRIQYSQPELLSLLGDYIESVHSVDRVKIILIIYLIRSMLTASFYSRWRGVCASRWS